MGVAPPQQTNHRPTDQTTEVAFERNSRPRVQASIRDDMTRRLDRTGEPINDDPDGEHDERCRDGWLGYDHEMRPIPCLVCRPRLRTTVRSTSGLIR